MKTEEQHRVIDLLLKRLDDGTPASAYEDDWGHQILPRNLVRGVYRGSRRPIDIYRRIYNGINGTPMPAYADILGDEDRWHLVSYILSLRLGDASPNSTEGR